jgi:hypothetical protein
MLSKFHVANQARTLLGMRGNYQLLLAAQHLRHFSKYYQEIDDKMN